VWRTRGAKRSAERLETWSSARGAQLASWKRTLSEMRAVGTADFATLTVGVDAVRGLTSS
jgi:NAD-specific glutamate dehydrogenase